MSGNTAKSDAAVNMGCNSRVYGIPSVAGSLHRYHSVAEAEIYQTDSLAALYNYMHCVCDDCLSIGGVSYVFPNATHTRFEHALG